MKRIFYVFGLLSFMLASCTSASPDADQVAVLIKKPWFFGHGGVDDKPVSPGMTWCAITTDVAYFNVTPQTCDEPFEDMMPSDNTPVSFNAYLKYQIIPEKTPELYQKFGAKWYENSLSQPFRTMIRDCSSSYTMFQLSSNRKISAAIETEVYNKVVSYVKQIGLPINILQVTVGMVKPPKEVLSETKNTAAQNQSKLTQEARANAELARKQAEINKAIADKAYQTQMGMTTTDYLHLRQLEIEKEKVELIKDNKNVSIIFGSAGVVTNVK